MAFYDYRCKQCQAIYTIERPVTETKEPNCAVCKTSMTRIFSLAGVTFKGEGWGHQ